MTTYTAADVRETYKHNSDTLTADLTDEQATTIASLWTMIEEDLINAYKDKVGDADGKKLSKPNSSIRQPPLHV